MSIVGWLAMEIAKRQGPWEGVDRKGNPETKEQLFTAIVVMPNQAAELLALAELGEQHTPEAVGKRMQEGAAAREPQS